MLVSFKAIGRNIRAARTALDITQEEAADRLKISQLHFGRLERGERPISLEMLAQIASVLDVSLSALLNGCMIGEDFSQRPSRGSESLGQSVAAIANGCSSASQRLMLELCRVVAQSDKQSHVKPDGECAFLYWPRIVGARIPRPPHHARTPSPVDAFAAQTKPLPTHRIGRGLLIPATLQSPIETEPG